MHVPTRDASCHTRARGHDLTGLITGRLEQRPDLRILRDPFSAKPHVLFYATKRIGGDVSDFAAIKLLKFATA